LNKGRFGFNQPAPVQQPVYQAPPAPVAPPAQAAPPPPPPESIFVTDPYRGGPVQAPYDPDWQAKQNASALSQAPGSTQADLDRYGIESGQPGSGYARDYFDFPSWFKQQQQPPAPVQQPVYQAPPAPVQQPFDQYPELQPSVGLDWYSYTDDQGRTFYNNGTPGGSLTNPAPVQQPPEQITYQDLYQGPGFSQPTNGIQPVQPVAPQQPINSRDSFQIPAGFRYAGVDDIEAGTAIYNPVFDGFLAPINSAGPIAP
jgi:hypothetical protein